MAAAIPYAMMALSAAGSIGQAKYQERLHDLEAAQLKDMAISEKAMAHEEARKERKKAELLMSRAMAVAGASGTDVQSPGIQDIVSDIDEQGEYNALAALYSGATAEQSRRYESTIATAKGRNAINQGYMKAGASIFNNMSSMYG